MKSKQEEEIQKGKLQEDDFDAEYEDESIDVGGPGVASGKGSKFAIIGISALLMAFILYFLFFNSNENKQNDEKLDLVTNESDFTSDKPAQEGVNEDFDSIFNDEVNKNNNSENYIINSPDIPTLPNLPKIFDDKESAQDDILPEFFNLPEEKERDSKLNEQQEEDIFDINPPENVLDDLLPPSLKDQNQQEEKKRDSLPDINNINKPDQPKENTKKPSPIIVVVGNPGPTNSIGYENNIIDLNNNPIAKLEETKPQISSSYIGDRSTMLIQGKIMTAVLETAINSEFPGEVRGIISRDVYAESGNNILIPRGSRIFGSYSSTISRGQARIEINWTRLIRPDGVDANIAFNASDQFGRSGIEGDVDNKYGSIITNSLLTSILAVSGAIAAEKLSDSAQTTTSTDTSTGTSTTTGSPSSQVIADVSQGIIDTVGTVVGNTLNSNPIIRVPQGTKMTIVVNGDMSLPEFKK